MSGMTLLTSFTHLISILATTIPIQGNGMKNTLIIGTALLPRPLPRIPQLVQPLTPPGAFFRSLLTGHSLIQATLSESGTRHTLRLENSSPQQHCNHSSLP